MKRRGPDFGDYIQKQFGKNNLLFIHSRLNIIDLSNLSNQPFHNQRSILAFNGEIYNFIEIKKILESKGCIFKSKGDTEVLFCLLNNYGFKSIERCEGMWGIAYYDVKSNKLFLSRDRFGEKPLYYYEDNNGLYFGSEIKFIAKLIGKKLDINFKQVKRFLVNGYKSLYKTNETFFQDINEVKPGSFLEVKVEKKISIYEKKYWTPIFDRFNHNLKYGNIVEKSIELLEKSLKIRMRSDVPLAFCLSGGVDSNALISLARKKLNKEVHGFTIVNEDERYQEKEMVKISVRENNIKHTEVNLSKENFFGNLKEQINYHDAPIYTITYYAQWLLMKAINQNGYKVSISGTGADEIFSGYYDHHNAYLAYIKKNQKSLYPKVLNNWEKKIKGFIRNPFVKNKDLFVDNENMRDHIYLDNKYFSSFLKDDFNEEFKEENYSEILLRNRMNNELFHESVPVILHEDDLNAMYYSVENRSPFLDREIFEFMQTVPSKFLIRNGMTKCILRDSVINFSPKEIIYNPKKIGFNTTLSSFIDLESQEIKDFLLDDSPIFEIIQKTKINNLFKKDLENSRNKFLFNFINTKLFIEQFS
tara:strand:+ start:15 stop:1778 length:1764 start_codon:yes stop_codon:yes gene_type:complete